MAKIKASKMVEMAKHVEGRPTMYWNNFNYYGHAGGNCGLVHDDGVQSFDCNNFVKSLINKPEIAYSTKVWDYAPVGAVIPDVSEYGLLSLCTDIVWGDFRNLAAAEILYMAGHIGLAVPEYTDPSGIVNCIEATAAMGGGVLSSYCDPYGNRYDHKGGNFLGRWEAHGKLTPYIEYEGGWVKYVNGDWYYVENGNIIYNYNGLAQNENGWWMIQNGKVDFFYNGLAINQYGTWVLKDGKVNFDFSGSYSFSGSSWKVSKGKVQF